jgi:hypothetical protein
MSGRGSLAGRAVTTSVMLAVSAAVQVLVTRLRTRGRAALWSILRITRLAKLISFYRHFKFDLPRLSTTGGVSLLLGIAAIRLYLLADGDPPTYLGAYFALIGALATVAAIAMVAGRWPALVRFGWALGALVALASLLMYIASRTAGLPELDQYVGRWDYPLGTFAMALSASYLGLHFAVLTKLTVAYPEHQQWHD